MINLILAEISDGSFAISCAAVLCLLLKALTMRQLSLLLLFCTWNNIEAQTNVYPRVRVSQGIVAGTLKKSLSGREFASFEGIPYARPPVGKYRFREPQRLKPWIGIWEAKEPASKCMQIDPLSPKEGSEDCLYLNVYTPRPDGVSNFPVVVYIHGGAFMFGDGSDFGPKYIMDKDLVYVTINYRLNVFGFLSTGDDIASGNMGLKDQSLALNWIRTNIIMFGGDPNSVTLIGLSAGGASVHYHYLSPLSRGTFNRAISFSGTAFSPWALTRNPLSKSRILASSVGCPITTNREMIECLRYRPANVLLSATKIQKLRGWQENMFSAFTPVVEDPLSVEPFLSQLPYEIIRSGRAQQLPWMTSVTTQEGLYPGAFYSTDELLQELEENWESMAPYIFVYNDTLSPNMHKTAANSIKQHYFQGSPLTKQTYQNLLQALGDRLFVIGAEKAARLQAMTSNQPVYFYKFGFRGPQSWSDTMSGSHNNYGVSHGDDTLYITDTPYLDVTLGTETVAMSKYMIDMLYNYAATGVPQQLHNQWDPVGKTREFKYLEIYSATQQEMKTTFDLGNNNFWKTLGIVEVERGSAYLPRDEF